MHRQGQNQNKNHVSESRHHPRTAQNITWIQNEMVQKHLHVLSQTQKISRTTWKTFQRKVTPKIRRQRRNQTYAQWRYVTSAIRRIRVWRWSHERQDKLHERKVHFTAKNSQSRGRSRANEIQNSGSDRIQNKLKNVGVQWMILCPW